MYFTATALNVGASIGFTFLLGPPGPLVGTLAAFLTVNLWRLPAHLHATFGVSPRALYLALLGPLAWGVAHGGALHLLARAADPQGWGGLVGWMLLGGVTSLGGAFFVVLGPGDRARWAGRLRALVGRSA
jgi:hypothetical protein